MTPPTAVPPTDAPNPPPAPVVLAAPALGGVGHMDRWVCGGVARDGGRCRQVLMEVRLAPGSAVRIKCAKCGAWHTREAA